MSFSDLGLSDPILKALETQGYREPSPIQAKAIPHILAGKDVMAAAQTGTGKTAGFTLPMLERLSQGRGAQSNQVRALILTPTRELAAQVGNNIEQYSAHLSLTSHVVFGGVKINPQMQRLRSGADLLVATPGRLLDLYQQNAVRFDHLEVFVLDEADRMLDMGFIHDLRKILAILPKQRQNLLFSATFSEEIRELARTIVHQPVEVSVTPPNSANRKVTQWLHPVDKKSKPALLAHLIQTEGWQQVLVFCRTKHGANRLTQFLEKNQVKAAAIHGNKSQGSRTRALAEFKAGDVQALVATDIAARGLDIHQLPQVVNFDLPNVAADYVHRIGRTGRAGASGKAVSLVSADEFEQLDAIEQLLQKHIPRQWVGEFDPVHSVPDSKPIRPPRKPKKPKKPKVALTEAKGGDREQGRGRKPASGRPSSNKAANKKPFSKNRPASADRNRGGTADESGSARANPAPRRRSSQGGAQPDRRSGAQRPANGRAQRGQGGARSGTPKASAPRSAK